MSVQASVNETVYDLLEPVVSTLHVELLEVELNGGTLRVTIDAEGGITSDRLAEVNRLISPVLDQHDPIPGRYTLEVSSPGLERPLKTATHFERAIGEAVLVKTEPGNEPRRIKGQLLSLDTDADDGAAIDVKATEVDGVELDEVRVERVALATIAKARTVFDWGPGPKPGGPKPKAKKASKRGAR